MQHFLLLYLKHNSVDCRHCWPIGNNFFIMSSIYEKCLGLWRTLGFLSEKLLILIELVEKPTDFC